MKRFLLLIVLTMFSLYSYGQSALDTNNSSNYPFLFNRDNCCLVWVDDYNVQSSKTGLTKVIIYDSESREIGRGEWPSKYLVPHLGSIKLDWMGNTYVKIVPRSNTIQVGTAYELYIQLLDETVKITNPINEHTSIHKAL